MRAFPLWKTLPIALLALSLQTPLAMAGATNSGDNTTATPGENSTTTGTPAEAGHDRRKGTTKTDDMKSTKKQHKSGSDKSSTSGSDSTTSGSGSSE